MSDAKPSPEKPDADNLERRLEHERRARTEIEAALEQKALALTQANNELRQLARTVQDREARTRAILEAAAEGILTLDGDNQIEAFNAAAEEIFGYSGRKVAGQDVNLLIAAPYQEKPQPGSPRLSNLQAIGLRRNGTTFPMEMGISQAEVGGRLLVVLIVRDITDRQHVERELHRVNHALERARDQALDASRAKSAFLANMSHELRTPLNAIIGYSEMLQEEAVDAQLPQVVGDLQKIHTAGKHLLALINDVLDLSKIEAGKMDLFLETIDVPALIDEVVVTIRPLAEKNADTLEVKLAEDLGVVQADATKFRQVLYNLLSNACKFTEKGTIMLEAVRQGGPDGGFIRIDVVDSGIGMTPDQMVRLFQDFTQGDSSTTRRFGGTGLGLAISRRFCRLMGGDIAVESVLGQGSRFTVSLPVEQGHGDLAGAPLLGLADAEPENETILVIDDDPQARDMIERRLAKEGYQVVCADGGVEGLRLARSLHPRAITLDVMMPGMDGWAVLSALKADPALAEIPVVLLTIVSDQNLGYTLGAADYLVKPIDRDRLVAVLNRYRGAGAPLNVLVVEDDPMIRELLGRLLQGMGCVAHQTGSGRAALEFLDHTQPHLILLDLMMPEMDGFQFLDELQKQPARCHIPVIVLSAMDLGPEDRQRLNGRVLQTLRKGARSREDLLGALHQFLQGKKLARTQRG